MLRGQWSCISLASQWNYSLVGHCEQAGSVRLRLARSVSSLLHGRTCMCHVALDRNSCHQWGKKSPVQFEQPGEIGEILPTAKISCYTVYRLPWLSLRNFIIVIMIIPHSIIHNKNYWLKYWLHSSITHIFISHTTLLHNKKRLYACAMWYRPHPLIGYRGS